MCLSELCNGAGGTTGWPGTELRADGGIIRAGGGRIQLWTTGLFVMLLIQSIYSILIQR
jgi:hypothetical protein